VLHLLQYRRLKAGVMHQMHPVVCTASTSSSSAYHAVLCCLLLRCLLRPIFYSIEFPRRSATGQIVRDRANIVERGENRNSTTNLQTPGVS
jgi:hypothetical protein